MRPHDLRSTTVLVALLLGACEVHDDATQELEAEDAIDEIVQNLRIAGFPEPEIEVRDDGVVMVGGDAVVTLEASREMAAVAGGEGEDAFRQYRVNWTMIGSWNTDICIDGRMFDNNPTLNTALDGAIQRYNGQNLIWNMRRVGANQAGCDSVIVARTTGGTSSSAGFPSGGMPYSRFWIATGILGDGEARVRETIMHELGHCIGFRHTDYYNRNISCAPDNPGVMNEGAGSAGAVQIGNTPGTATDGASFMNACRTIETATGEFRDEDKDALHTLWGNNCCSPASSGAGCGVVAWNECVGAVDPYCNDVHWDWICVAEVTSLGCGSCATNCCVEHGSPWCDAYNTAECVCWDHPWCCETGWDAECVAAVVSHGCGFCG